MKTPLIALASLFLVLPASGVEFKTLTPATSSHTVSTDDIVEIVGTTMNNDGNAAALQFTFADAPGSPVFLTLRGKESVAFDDMKGNIFTGLTTVTLIQPTGGTSKDIAVTIKITPAEELSVASEGTVLVVPDSTTGDLTVLVESSNDMVNWSTFLSQNITAGNDPKFYRSRIIKNVSP